MTINTGWTMDAAQQQYNTHKRDEQHYIMVRALAGGCDCQICKRIDAEKREAAEIAGVVEWLADAEAAARDDRDLRETQENARY